MKGEGKSRAYTLVESSIAQQAEDRSRLET